MTFAGQIANEDSMMPEVFQRDINSPSEVQVRFGSIWQSDSESSISAVLEKQDRSLVVIRGICLFVSKHFVTQVMF